MLVSILNYLNNGFFLENVGLQNLQNCVEVSGQTKSLFQDGNQQINADGNPDLGLDGIGRCSIRSLDSQVLPMKKFDASDLIDLVSWIRTKNHRAYLSHRKRKLATLRVALDVSL